MNETTQRVILENQVVIMQALTILLGAIPYSSSKTFEGMTKVYMTLAQRIGATEAQFDYIKRP